MTETLQNVLLVIIVIMLTEFGIAKFIVHKTLRNKRMSQTEIEIRLKNRNTILPTVLTLLTICS